MPRLALLLPLVLLACSPAAPAASSPPVPMGEPPPAAAPAEERPSARVTAVAGSRDNEANARAKIIFTNPAKRACRVLGYTLVWARNKKRITLQDLTLPPGETRERWIKVNPDDGDIAALTPESGQVELETDCGH